MSLFRTPRKLILWALFIAKTKKFLLLRMFAECLRQGDRHLTRGAPHPQQAEARVALLGASCERGDCYVWIPCEVSHVPVPPFHSPSLLLRKALEWELGTREGLRHFKK